MLNFVESNHPIMTPYLSDKIRLLSFFSIIMVLFIHSSFQETAEGIQGMSFNINLQYFISQMLCRCAVPLFFCISGYLFFLHTESGIKAVVVKMRKRFRTLVIPFIVSIIFFLLSFVAINGFLIGGTDEIYEFSFTKNSFPKIVYALTADSGTGYPLPFHLWFLRDLIAIVLLSPLLYYIRKHVNAWIVMSVTFIIATVFVHFPLPTSIFWFLLGSYCLDRKYRFSWVFPSVFLVLCVVQQVFPHPIWDYVNIPVIILGLISIWTIYDKIISPDFSLASHPWLMKACSFTFFIYLFHIPTLYVLRKIMLIPFGHTSLGMVFVYLAAPIVFAIGAVIAGSLLKRFIPKIYSFCVGGR